MSIRGKKTGSMNFLRVKNQIVYRLINREKNKKLLSEVPYMPWKDLAIVFYLLLEMDEHQMQQAAMLIKKEQLEWWNTSTEDLSIRMQCLIQKSYCRMS